MGQRLDNDDDIRRLAAEGHWADEIARRLNCSSSNVRKKARNLGISLPRKTPQRQHLKFADDLFMQAAELGMTVHQAAREIGCNENVVRRRAIILGIKFKPADQPPPMPTPAPPKRRQVNTSNPKTLADYAAIENAAMRARDAGWRQAKI